jgi:hypothetical protein
MKGKPNSGEILGIDLDAPLLERHGFTRIEFVHLHPIEGIAVSKSGFLPGVKNACFEVVRALSVVSRGRLNFDNLFVIAHRGSPVRR